MAEGALTVAPAGLILFSNEKLASILAIPHERVIGLILVSLGRAGAGHYFLRALDDFS